MVIFRITRMIQQRGMTQEQFANLVGISLSYLRQIEYGAKYPSFKVLARIADALDCSIKDLFEEVKE